MNTMRGWLVAAFVVFSGPWTPAEEEALPPISTLPGEQAFLDGFAEALRGFRAMSLEEFLERYGPRKAYLEGAFIRGDATLSGAVDLSDAICILVYLFDADGPCGQPRCADTLDVDDSGAVDLTDAISLLQYLFSGGPEPAEPFDTRGLDSTPDALPCAFSAAGRLGYEPLHSEYLNQIFNAYPPSLRQEDLFRENGFVVYESVEFESMMQGFFEVYRRDLPVYISVDSILDALHLSFDRILILLEEGYLSEELSSMLGKMESGIDALRAQAPGIDIERELDDVAVWTCAARSLLAGEKAPCARGVDARVSGVLAHVAAESIETVDLFGVETIDFSQFRPRGHYTRSEKLERYFRSMMWVQRIGLGFAQKQRHAIVAALLTRLLDQSGATEHWTRLDDAIEVLVGFSDSLNPPGLRDFLDGRAFGLADLHDGDRFRVFREEALAAGVGRQLINSQILMSNPYDPEGFTSIPPAFHVMGQRFIVDSYVFTNVVWDRVPSGRPMPSPLDAWFVLGNRVTVPLLSDELSRWDYHANLAALDHLVASYEPDFWSGNLYNVWLSALRTLSADTTGPQYPPVMRTREWDRRMLHAQLASWAHMRHDFILYAKPSYGPGGCFYPDGWVDPYPEFYETIAAFARRAREALPSVYGTWGEAPPYWPILEQACTQLAGIARAELEGADLSEDQTQFIRTWLSQTEGYRGEQPVDRLAPFFFNGWYPRMVFQADINRGEGFDPTIADIHTKLWPPPVEVLHVGVGYPNLQVISVKNECGIRAYAGPVFSYHEFTAEGATRWTDEEWREELETGGEHRPAWTLEFIR